MGLLAPYAPFVSEEIYQRLTGENDMASVHMVDWPEPDPELRAETLEAAIDRVRDVEEAGQNARQDAGRKLRWPVTRVVVDAAEDSVVEALDAHRDLLAERLNAREVELVGTGEDWADLQYTATADMSVLGPAFGDRAQDVMQALNDARVPEPDLGALESAANELLEEPVELTEEMVSFERVPPAGVAGATFEGGVVYVDTELTEDVESEGYAREVIRRVQEMRKDLDLAMDERIRLEVVVFDDRIGQLVAAHEDLIAAEVRAADLGEVEDGHRETWDIEGTRVDLAIDPVG